MSTFLNDFNNQHYDYLGTMRDVWDIPIGVAAAGVTVGLILYLVLSCLGAMCLMKPPAPGRKCSFNCWGVQLVGCSWVCFTLYSILYMFFACIFIILGIFATDGGSYLYRAPREPVGTMGAYFCNRGRLNVGSLGYLDTCNITRV